MWLVVLIDWTIRDSVSSLAFVFYATPPVVLGLMAFLLAWIGLQPKGTRSAPIPLLVNRTTAILGAICLIQWAAVSFRLGASSERSPETLKVVFWNIGRGQFASWERIAEQARAFDADVLAFAEATDDRVQTPEFWETTIPGYSSHPLNGSMVVLVRGKAIERTVGLLKRMGRYCHLSLEVRGTQFDLLIADLESNPFRSREQPLKELFNLMRGQTVPTLVVGDFNTPPASIWFDDWRPEYKHAWETAGHGYQATWPQPLPVLALDHVWGNGGIAFQHCRCGWTRCSDHRPVIVDLTVKARD